MTEILVVDDDQNTRKYIKTVLEGNGYHVIDAENGEAALDAMEKNHVDLVVIDVMMPKMDGYTFTETVRSTDEALPILMVSAKQMPADRHRGFIAGTDDYITKPIDADEMVLRIRALLRRAKIASERKITVGQVVLDYDSFTVSRPGEVQELPQKEFLLFSSSCRTPAKYLRAFSLWIRSGAPTARRAGKR